MAHVPLTPIGRPRDQVADDRTFHDHREKHEALDDVLDARRAEVAAGWGDKYKARVHQKGKLTARERVDLLKDAGTRIFEVGTFVNYEVGFGEKNVKCPGAGVGTPSQRSSCSAAIIRSQAASRVSAWVMTLHSRLS